MQFRLNEINEVKDYFIAKVCEKEKITETLSKYIVVLDYVSKTLLLLTITGAEVFTDSFVTTIGV